MHDYTITDPHCIADTDFFRNDCGSPAWAYGLFVSWNILSMYIFASMVIGYIDYVNLLASHCRLREFFVRLSKSWKASFVHS